MEEINLDLNNLFNLSYSFEGLKILLTNIAKNQDQMLQKIKQIENNQILNEKREKIESPKKNIQVKKVENQANKNKEISNITSTNDKNIYTNYLISDLVKRISNLENKYRNMKGFIPQNQEPRTLNDILEENKLNLNELNENVKELYNNLNNLKETVENIKLKVMDFSIFEVLREKNITVDADVAELLIKNLENKMNEKFKYNDDKFKKDEQDIIKLKTDSTNTKNSLNFQSKNLSYMKDEILSIQKNIEDLRATTSDIMMKNEEQLDKLRENNNTKSNEFTESISYINSKISLLEEKLKKISNDFKNNN